MASVNKAIVLGNLGRDPELRHTQSGKAVCQLNVATTETWNDQSGERQEKTEWHRIVVWGRQAENCDKYLSKGRSVYVEGRIQTRKWQDKDGADRYSTEIVADRVQFIGGGAGARDSGGGSDFDQSVPLEPPPSSSGGDDIPF
jgi:single-strand DNA-binding protein